MLSAGVVAPHELAFQPFHALLIVWADADFQQAFRFGTPDGEQAVGAASLQRFGAIEVVAVFGRFLFFAFHHLGGQCALAGKCVAHAVSGTFVFANMLGYDVTGTFQCIFHVLHVSFHVTGGAFLRMGLTLQHQQGGEGFQSFLAGCFGTCFPFGFVGEVDVLQ